MYLYSIMTADMEHVDEICEDIRSQYENGVANFPLFKMTLVPEGNPPINKAAMFCEQYRNFQEKLNEWGIPNGILVQASIGHGYKLNEMFPFQRYRNLTDGQEMNVCCPYDENFRKHFRSVMSILASAKPDVIMVDDDFRLMNRDGRGCACDLHLKEFNRLAGTSFDRAELYNALMSDEPKSKEYLDIYMRTQGESLMLAAKEMRAGIDDVDPTIPCVFCGCGYTSFGNGCEVAAEIAGILAAKGQPSIVRLNNGGYAPAGTHYFSEIMHRFAMQAAVINKKADVLLAETDTCPQNRYSTGAQYLHAHFTASILEGARGAKHWITRMRTFEPGSGKAYRDYLGSHRGFYEKLGKLLDTATPIGCRVPLTSRQLYYYGEDSLNENGWVTCVLERLGIPFYYSVNDGGAVVMSGNSDKKFTNEEILRMLEGTMLLASDTARNLEKRGFSKYLGVSVKDWNGSPLSGEVLKINNKTSNVQMKSCELIPLNENVCEDSYVYHLKGGKEEIKLFPGTTIYKNELGGTVVTFCGTPKAGFNYMEAFSFLTESRKLQLVSLLKQEEKLPVYYPEDAEMLLRAYYLEDGSIMCILFNLGFDVLETIPLVVEKSVSDVSVLYKDGTEQKRDFTSDGEKVTVDVKSHTLDPVVLILK